MMTMGEDFMYENAREWYDNLDKLIKYVNAMTVRIISSTKRDNNNALLLFIEWRC